MVNHDHWLTMVKINHAERWVREGFEFRRLAAVFTQSLQLDLNELTLQASSKVKSQYVPTLWSKISKLPKSPTPRWRCREFFVLMSKTRCGSAQS